ncbi:hypothetical protein K492DRAFT_177333 [Lichtheimia hyalospora FSU 10163]|nr:hypothetical protein K492DRAFT_177333 [Lichtheimia hyalospora FSU 10163]
MFSIFAAIVTTLLILIPSVPLFIYVVGLLLPEEHTVSRSATLHTTVDKLWSLLTHVQDYPSWQPSLDRIECIREENVAEQQVVFVEYTQRNKRITTVVDAAGYRVLSRMTEEDSTTTNTNTASNTLKHKPTFIGTWTFDITENKQDDNVIITITEKGVITRPMVRLLHLTLLGFHRRIDRFLKDLENKIHHDAIMQEPVMEDNQHAHVDEEQLSNAINQDVTENKGKEQEEETLSQESITPSTTTSNNSSPTVDKEWDLMSEIYERPNAHA